MKLLMNRRIHKSKGDRRVTWLELFFDLVTVVAISRLGLLLHHDHSFAGVLAFAGLLIVVWWVWISYSYLADIFDNDSAFDRLIQLTGMAGLAIVALSLPGGQTASPTLFAAANAGLFALLGAVYLFSGRSEPEARELSRWYVSGSWTGALLWIVSIFMDAPLQYYAWGAAVLANALISGPLAYARMRHAPEQNSHMPERFGLFLLIVLGEVILATINGIADVHLNGTGIATGLAGFAIAAAIWWIYFDHFDGSLITKAIQHGPGAQVRSFIYGYGHLLVYAAIIITGVGIELAIEHAGAAEPLIGTGVAGVMCGFILTSIGTGREMNRLFVFFKTTIVLGAAACAVFGLAALWTCLVLVVGLALLICAESQFLPAEKSSGV
jgi:low temperature requirement protein LtrA